MTNWLVIFRGVFFVFFLQRFLFYFLFYFQSFFYFIFLISPEKNSKTSKVNQQSVLNL